MFQDSKPAETEKVDQNSSRNLADISMSDMVGFDAFSMGLIVSFSSGKFIQILVSGQWNCGEG